MPKILKINYDTGGTFNVQLDENSTDVIATDTFNQLAIDAAFERRVPVVLELDGNRIHRVQSDAARNTTESPVRGATITRISTQVQPGGLVAEVFFTQGSSPDETSARSHDPVVHLLCHGAYLSKHRLMLTLDEQRFITGVVKERFDVDPSVAASQ